MEMSASKPCLGLVLVLMLSQVSQDGVQKKSKTRRRSKQEVGHLVHFTTLYSNFRSTLQVNLIFFFCQICMCMPPEIIEAGGVLEVGFLLFFLHEKTGLQ